MFPKSDTELREAALDQAIRNSVGSGADRIVEEAEKFYTFLKASESE